HALVPASLLAHPGLPLCAQRCGLPVTGPHPPALFALCWLRVTAVSGVTQDLSASFKRKNSANKKMDEHCYSSKA
ncbi:hypothetical protein, partial [Erwinia sp. ErVv1]|uniref:hypothetical protein n=1 Tax=Erwinia sp. ErVv1 TaxID=1603299 RepID=UPI001E5C70AA